MYQPGVGTDRISFWLPDRILPDINLLSGKPDFAGPEPVVRKGKYQAAGMCRKIQINHYYWAFVIINYHINPYKP